MEFHNKLYNLRKQKGLSQEELANRLNVSRQTISKWEVGDLMLVCMVSHSKVKFSGFLRTEIM